MMFRRLRADEIECRVARVAESGNLMLLLYKDARCDMNILDETVGAMNWKREHARDNANCIVSIYDANHNQWVSKEDTGTESNTEKEKGLASDSFKRACVNWGIGRELYTAPQIWVRKDDYKPSGKSTYDKFSVMDIGYDDNGNIVSLTIKNETLNRVVFKMGETTTNAEDPEHEKLKASKINKAKITALTKKAESDHVSLTRLCDKYGIKNLTDMTEEQFSLICNSWTSVVMVECKA